MKYFIDYSRYKYSPMSHKRRSPYITIAARKARRTMQKLSRRANRP